MTNITAQPQSLDHPASVTSPWTVICSAPDVAESGDSLAGTKVVKPSHLITRSGQNELLVGSQGTLMAMMLKYNDGVTSPTSPVVRVFGKDRNGLWCLIADDDGNVEHTLTIDANTDVRDDDHHYTLPVRLDMNGATAVAVGIQTAFGGTGTTDDSEILVKIM